MMISDYFHNLPFKILYLLEQINVKFIQQVYISHSDINVKNYALDLNARILKKNNQELKLTEREIEAIIFLQNKNEPVSVEKLQKEVWKYGEDLETHTVETHIYRLRKKISEKFLDEKFIINNKEGYYLWKREINMRLIYLQKNIEKELLNQKKEKEASKEEKNNLF